MAGSVDRRGTLLPLQRPPIRSLARSPGAGSPRSPGDIDPGCDHPGIRTHTLVVSRTTTLGEPDSDKPNMPPFGVRPITFRPPTPAERRSVMATTVVEADLRGAVSSVTRYGQVSRRRAVQWPESDVSGSAFAIDLNKAAGVRLAHARSSD